MDTKFQYLRGPNKYADFEGVLLTHDLPDAKRFSATAIEKRWQDLLGSGQPLWERGSAERDVSFTELCAAIICYLYKPKAFMDVDRLAFGRDYDEARSWILVRCTYPEVGRFVLTNTIQLTRQLLSTLIRGGSLEACANLIANTLSELERVEPSPGVQTLIREALARGIPVYPIAPAARIYWQFGQGVYSRLTAYTGSDRDSRIGKELCHNKFLANNLIMGLGFPGVLHDIVFDSDAALKAAEHIAYPLVVKPASGAMGLGVTANVKTPEELKGAYDHAATYSKEGILVERFVEGIDHRISLFGGKVVWVSAKYPAQVIGDGAHNLGELIKLENERREREGGSKQTIEMDDETTEILAQRSLDYSHYPASGETVQLRTVANLSKGGTREDVSDRIHPDNRYMVEVLAKALRMDSLGIDFITPDISVSWREVSCGIIEVNQSPGFSEDWQAALYIDALFPPNTSRSRIPNVLLLGNSREQEEAVVNELIQQGLETALVRPDLTRFQGFSRGRQGDNLYRRVASMLMEPSCEALVISADEDYIDSGGLPLDVLDLAFVRIGVASHLSALLNMHCRTVVELDADSSNISLQHLHDLKA